MTKEWVNWEKEINRRTILRLHLRHKFEDYISSEGYNDHENDNNYEVITIALDIC